MASSSRGWWYLDLADVMVDPERGILDPHGSTGQRTRPEHDATQLGHPDDPPIDLPTDVIEAESGGAIQQRATVEHGQDAHLERPDR